jgi:uncharacterized delta-60 repeat protein
LDSSFGSGGKTLIDFSSFGDPAESGSNANAVIVQSDGRIVVGGRVSGSGTSSFALARLNADGSLDATFGIGGRATTNFNGGFDRINALALQSDVKIIAVGKSIPDGEIGGTFAVARYQTNGALDAGFGSGGKLVTSLSQTNDEAFAVVIQPDGKIIAVGTAPISPVDQLRPRIGFVRYNPNGSLDSNFGNGGKVTTASFLWIKALALHTDGKILVAGNLGADVAVLRLNSNGTLDQTFGSGGQSTASVPDRQALVTALNGGTETRAAVLHKVVNGTRVLAEGQLEIIAAYGKAFCDTQFSPSFVQMEYFGYLPRNEDTPGFNFWLNKLNSFSGDFIEAEMVRSFLMSPEYRRRFAEP